MPIEENDTGISEIRTRVLSMNFLFSLPTEEEMMGRCGEKYAGTPECLNGDCGNRGCNRHPEYKGD